MNPGVAEYATEAAVLQWLRFDRLLPTRNLQLAMELAFRRFGILTDHTLAFGILKNCPGIISAELLADVRRLLEALESSGWLRQDEQHRTPGYSKHSEPIRRVQRVLNEFLAERERGLHIAEEDYSVDIVRQWLSATRHASAEEVTVLGTADYLRLVARAVDHGPGGKFVWTPDHLSMEHVSTLPIAEAFERKTLTRLLKRLAKSALVHSAAAPQHQDIVLLLGATRIHVRPLSFVADASWAVNAAGDTSTGTIQNLLSDSSPVHTRIDDILELEELVNSSTAAERDFQAFFERCPAFLLGTDYSKLVSHPVLVRDDEADLVPDFILIPHAFATPKILELKLPSSPLARHQNNRVGFLSGIITARDQLLEYRNFFSTRTAARLARERWGCEIYLPRIAVVVGRASSFASDYERRKVESRLPDVEVLTYDDILSRARSYREMIT